MLKFARFLLNAALAMSLLGVSSGRSLAQDGLKPGEVLDQTNWQKAEGLLPPEILKHYEKGEYANAIVDFPDSQYNWPPDFREASERNAGQLDVNALGAIVEKGSGKQPDHILGFPFPIIDPADPNAGVKVLWNYDYRTWYFGTFFFDTNSLMNHGT
jgi:hypothetical protein